MSQRKNIGKIAVTIQQPELVGDAAKFASSDGTQKQPSIIRHDASYLISGGLGALGVATARWLTQSSAGGVVLMSRRSPDAATQAQLDELSASGTPVVAIAGDVGDAESLKSALATIPENLPPVRGVMHAAGVLRDKLFNQMSPEDFAFPLPPKMTGTIHLDEATKDWDLDFFVLFSSVSSVLGTGGQSNYGAANSFLDTYAEYRRRQGRPMVAINWGEFAGAGMAADLADMMRSQGVEMLPIESSLKLIEPIVQSGQSRIAVFRADWNRFGNLLRSMMSGQLKFKLLETLAGDAIEGSAGESGGGSEAIRDEVADLANDQKKERLQQFFAEKLSEIMGIDPDDIDPETTLTSLGMDSLMAIELGNKMQTSLQMELPMSVYLEGPTIEKLAVYVVSVLDKESPKPSSDAQESAKEQEPAEIA
jgi:myxalamid-type polyketide synthase MxaB